MLVLKDSYIYEYSKDNAPIAHCASGDLVTFETIDCYAQQVKDENTKVESVDFSHCNPATGPLYVDGAEPGDTLAVDILDIKVAEQGVVTTMAGYGALKANIETRTRVVKVKDGYCYFKDVKWPCKPMIGVIGTAPDGDPVPSGYSFKGGGNMDSRLITKGVTVYFPVRVPGALLAMGDLHASMGDGEVSETGVEIDGEVLVRVRVIKNFKLNWPVTETSYAYFVNTDGISSDKALQSGYEELQRLIMNAYGWDETDACLYMSLRARIGVNQAVLDENDCDEIGPTFRVGVAKLDSMPNLIPTE